MFVRLRILEILQEQNHTKYWLYKRMDMMSYRNFKNIIEDQTSAIRFESLEKLARVLDTPVGLLFEQVDDEGNVVWPVKPEEEEATDEQEEETEDISDSTDEQEEDTKDNSDSDDVQE